MREPQSVDPFMLGIRRRNRRIAIATVLVFVVPVVYLTRSFALSGSRGYRNLENRIFAPERYEHDLGAEQSATIRKALDEARAHAEEARKKWRAAMDAAIAAEITERPDLGRCPTSVPVPSRIKDQLPSRPEWLTVAETPAELAAATPARWSSFEQKARYLETRAKEPSTDREAERLVKEAQDFARNNARDDHWPWEVLMVVDKRVAPVSISSEAGFTSGEVEGRAWLYDYRRGAVTCAGRVHAENSDEVRFKYTRRLGDPILGGGTMELDRALANDLRQESFRAAADALHFRAGPPLPPEP